MTVCVQVQVGDCVSLTAEKPNESYIARVTAMWEDDGKIFHALFFSRGCETVLGETSNPRELFLVDSCQDLPLTDVTGKVKVVHEEKDQEGDFFAQKWYDDDLARFEDPPPESLECRSCLSDKCKVG